MSSYSDYLEFKKDFDKMERYKKKYWLDVELFLENKEVRGISIIPRNQVSFWLDNKDFTECLRTVINNNRKGLLKKALDKYKRKELKKRLEAIEEVKKELLL